MWALGGIAVLGGLALVVGLLTPGAAAAVGLSALAIAAMSGLATDWRSAAFVAADALALAMLGPGAHSVDAYLFGRREILVSDDAWRGPRR